MLILLYLSVVSGALGFTLWTRSQAALTAFESSGINNLMLVEIALMDFLAFGRSFSVLQIAAILIVFISIVSIQTRRSAKKA
jgi:drug/metabolite transporter (DMT)-like permease